MNTISLNTALNTVKNAKIPVDFDAQYHKIVTRIEQKPFWRLQRPLVFAPALIALMLIMTTSIYQYNLTTTQNRVDRFLASAIGYDQNSNGSTALYSFISNGTFD